MWDVVDKAYSACKSGNGQSKSGKHSAELLDASVVDIYKGTHAVIFMISPSSVESLDYVRYNTSSESLSLHDNLRSLPIESNTRKYLMTSQYCWFSISGQFAFQ